MLPPAIQEKMQARRSLPDPATCRALRQVAGLSQADIASAVGVTDETVSRWENGHRRPRGAVLIRYVALLDDLRGGK